MRIPAGPPRTSRRHFISTRRASANRSSTCPSRALPSRAGRTPPTLDDAGEAHGGSRRACTATQRRDRDHESPARVRLLRRSQDVGRRRGSVRHRRHDGDRVCRASTSGRTSIRRGLTARVGTRRRRDQRSHSPADDRDRDARRPHRSRARHRDRHDRPAFACRLRRGRHRAVARCGLSRSTRTSS